MAVLKLLWTKSIFPKTVSWWSSIISDVSLLMLISGIHICHHPSHAPSLSLTLFFLLYVFLLILCICLDSSTLESPSRLDEEHRLIARYAARLAAEASNSTVRLSSQTHSDDTNTIHRKREEKKNTLLMKFSEDTFYLLCGINENLQRV